MITADVSDLEVEVKHLTTILSFNLYKHLSALKSPTFPYMPPYMECFNTWECPMCRINGKHMEWSFQLFQHHLNGVSWCDTTCFFYSYVLWVLFILLLLSSTMNINIIMVNISRDDMDDFILLKTGCLTRNLSGITPAPPDQEEEKEKKSSLKRPDWLLRFLLQRNQYPCSRVGYST